MVNEKEILTRAINRLNSLEHIQAEIVLNPYNNLFDGELVYTWENHEIRLPINVKSSVSAVHINMFSEMKELYNEEFIVVAEYINPNLAKRLKSLGVFYIDTFGNIYINKSPILIDVKGDKGTSSKPKERLYTASGLQVLYSLLTNDGLLNKPYREIAEATKSANGTVSIIINNLKDYNFVFMDSNGKLIFSDKKKLLENWSSLYSQRLKSKRRIGRYESNLTNWWEQIDITEYNAQWSGEVAAVKTSNLLHSRKQTVYIDKNTVDINRLKLDARLIKDENGDVELIERFWYLPDNSPISEIVNPLLIYVDLIESNDPRNDEIASSIFKELLN